MAKPATELTADAFAPPTGLARVRARSLVVAAVGVIACALAAAHEPSRLMRSYLIAWLFWLGIPLGALGLLMLHHLTGGGWGMVIRRIFEAATRTLPLLLLLFVPIALTLGRLYPWADPQKVASDPLLSHRQPFMSMGFFLVRAAAYFAIWMGLAWRLNSLSRNQDDGDGAYFARRMAMVSGPGLVVFCLVLTLASVDWLMSLEPDWFSSIYGIYLIGAEALTAIAFVVVVARLLGRAKPMADVFVPQHFHDYGNLMFAFLMLWAYFSFSQYLIIWSGNLPEEITWYLERTKGGYGKVALLVVFFNFAIPFLLLLPHSIKRNARRLSMVALLVLVMRWVDLFWQAAPAMHITSLHWTDLAAPIAVGALWLTAFSHELAKRPLLPVHDPNLHLEEAEAVHA